MSERAMGVAEGSIRFNGPVWQVVRQGYWCVVEREHNNHEVEVEFHE